MRLSNLIIPEWDSRYGKLGHLYHKYNYDNIMIYQPNGCIYYKIPHELVLTEYETETVGIYLKHKFDDFELENYVIHTRFKHVLSLTCNLTVQEYYDILVRHCNSILNRPKCCNCGGLIKFSGWITHGYSMSETGKFYCSKTCQNNYQLWLIYNNRDKYPNVIKRLQNGGKNMNTLESKIKRLRSGFLAYGEPSDECHIYIAKTKSGKFKFGAVTDLDTRIATSTYEDEYVKAKIIFTGTRVEVADLEALIKCEKQNADEYLDFNKTMFEFRQAFIRALKKLKSGDFKF